MEDYIVYRPFLVYRWFALGTLGASMLLCIALGYSEGDVGINSLLLLMIVGALWCSKKLFDSYRTKVIFDQKELKIVRHDKVVSVSWKKLCCAYYHRNWKGHLFLVLAVKSLTQDRVKSYLNKSSNISKVYVDDVIILPIDELQDVKGIVELIWRKVPNVVRMCKTQY